MPIGQVDLNLLKVFDAIYEDRNLVAAGRRLHLSQSAVSHALSRLRMVMGDDLFVRTGKGMLPTARATAVAAELRDCLRRVEAVLGAERFDPATTTRRFVFAANDYLTATIMAPLLRTLRQAAPNLDVAILPSTRLDLAEQIDLGRIDLAIGIFAQVPERMTLTHLVAQGEALLLHKAHPAVGRRPTLKDLATYPLAVVSVGGREEGAVDGFLLERGLARHSEMFDRHALEAALAGIGARPRLCVAMPHALAIPALLPGSDMIAIVPQSLAQALAQDAQLQVSPLPYATTSVATSALWHRRNDHDALHLWIRGVLASTVDAGQPGLQLP
ncbi:LysR family transcriptional regulator [Xanthomonas axonopodis pv. poinsettiicola]|uniref:LysR family transcriptional regulator n=1 Tax=Xanthomonas TaxID=338 RepID=UPI001E3DE520|nr:LysR family transcriptional regulator [Xanthomonas codiaei]MCC8538405.1 LysR family transcriptional regulator [Xanthomonas codiaei]